MGCCSVNKSLGEFESKNKNRGDAGNVGRLPGGGGLELGLEGGKHGMLHGDPTFLATPLLRPDAEKSYLWNVHPIPSSFIPNSDPAVIVPML